MLRTGMLALQLLPSNSLAGIVIFTDGCCDVYSEPTNRFASQRGFGITTPGEASICDILGKLRNQTISCSFVQAVEVIFSYLNDLKITKLSMKNNNKDSSHHCFGYVPNSHLLKFIASATQGMYICLDSKTLKNWPPRYWPKKEGMDTDLRFDKINFQGVL